MRRLIGLLLICGVIGGLYVSTVALTDRRPLGGFAALENRIGELGLRVRRHLGWVEDKVGLLTTGLVTLSMRTYDLDPRPSNYGGAFFEASDQVFLVGSKGMIGRFSEGRFAPVQTRAPINFDAFLSDIEGTEFETWEAKAHFRINDAFARKTPAGHELFVLHHFWHSEIRRKVVRLSRLRFGQTEDLEAAKGEWETLIECGPPIEPDASIASPFATNRTGGRILEDTRDPKRPLLVGVGDHGFDGVGAPVSGLEEGSCFGKIIRVDAESGDWKVYASGFRNPSGMMLDSQGRLWETEHGPRGGDELNQVEAGLDYGWPSVTYGTDYDAPFVWPPNPHQGQHRGFQRPINAWVPSIGVSNLIELKQGPSLWQNDLLVASLRAGNVYRIKIAEGRAVVIEPISIGQRVRDLIQLEDGRVLLWTDSWSIIELKPETERLAESLLPVPLTDEERSAGLADLLARCTTCHSLEKQPSPTAPTLHGIYGRKVASTNFGYSDAMSDFGGVWNEERLLPFISNPSGSIPGTIMPYTGLSKDEASDIVKYLARLN